MGIGPLKNHLNMYFGLIFKSTLREKYPDKDYVMGSELIPKNLVIENAATDEFICYAKDLFNDKKIKIFY